MADPTVEVLDVRYTRTDESTVPGGIILRKLIDRHGPGKHEYVAHHFTRKPGEREPQSYHWGHYHDTEEKGRASFAKKVSDASAFQRGGSLIPPEDVERELEKESRGGQ